ncbi:MAG: RnfABCDGE type electron transport complex subunit B [Oscillospiraceae bacterium]|nr:RnfABCDGE type electron transport complex subunit B [Oscillospiraceae bacterium]
MDIVWITTAVITGIGLFVGTGLVFMGKKFHVEIDEREAAVRALLPGNNCGACGYAGCDAMAAAIARGEAPVNGCPVGGGAVAQQIGAVMGTDAGSIERKLAFVKCKGSCEYTDNQGNYVGIPDCASAARAGLALSRCDYGCLGLGSCAKVCPEGAIRVENGVAVVNRKLCVGCGLCAKACPKGLIELLPEHQTLAVQCSNRDRGPQVKQVCSAGCIGCMLCVRQCEHDAIHVENNLARIDCDACVQCGNCAEKCPSGVIGSTAALPVRKQPCSRTDLPDRKTLIWKAACCLLIAVVLILLLSGVLNV